MDTKVCSSCGKEFPLTAEFFHRNNAMKNGLNGRCKSCIKIAGKQYRTDNAEEIRKKDKERREGKDKVATTIRRKEYYEKHKEEVKEEARLKRVRIAEEKRIAREQYNEEHKEEVKAEKQRRKQERKEKQALACREYYQKHKEEMIEYQREYREKNSEMLAEQKRQWRTENVEESRARVRRYQGENPDVQKRSRDKYRNTPAGRIRTIIGNRIRDSLCGRKGGLQWQEIVGYKVKDLVKHLESQFKDGMSWENYGTWHIDHTKPVCLFDFNVPDPFAVAKKCWALSNLQPLWAIENLMKGAKYEEEVA